MRHVGSIVSGVSIASGLFILEPSASFSVSWFVAVVLIAFGTSAGERITAAYRCGEKQDEAKR